MTEQLAVMQAAIASLAASVESLIKGTTPTGEKVPMVEPVTLAQAQVGHEDKCTNSAAGLEYMRLPGVICLPVGPALLNATENRMAVGTTLCNPLDQCGAPAGEHVMNERFEPHGHKPRPSGCATSGGFVLVLPLPHFFHIKGSHLPAIMVTYASVPYRRFYRL